MQLFINGVRLEVEDTGEKDRVAVLLIPGMAMQLIVWPEAMVHQLHQAGYRVIRLDNRDIGLSQDMAHLPAPNLLWFMLQQKLGLQPQAPYSIQDMANDVLGVLDHLQINQAHLVGVSMGGMIGQRICIGSPQRALSLTSIMSSSGAKGLPGPYWFSTTCLKPDQHHEQQRCQRLARPDPRYAPCFVHAASQSRHTGCTSTCTALCASVGRPGLCPP